jgi:hypothetical protein
VNDYRDAVARQADIQFDAVGAIIESSGKCREGIFGSESRGATVADYQRRDFRVTVCQEEVFSSTFGFNANLVNAKANRIRSF